MNQTVADLIAESPLREWAFQLLSNVPGMPPLTQAVHILGIAAVMASSVMIDLRLLGLAVPSQKASEMIRRLMPWTWWALLVNFATGLPFVLARPYRYFLNPVFGWKLAFLVPALVLALFIHRRNRIGGYWDERDGESWVKVLAAVSLLLWIGVVLAGRWIAYSDYLFWPEE